MTVIAMVSACLQQLGKILSNQELILQQLANTNATQATILGKLEKLQSTVDLIDAAVFQPDQIDSITLSINTTPPVAPAET